VYGGGYEEAYIKSQFIYLFKILLVLKLFKILLVLKLFKIQLVLKLL